MTVLEVDNLFNVKLLRASSSMATLQSHQQRDHHDTVDGEQGAEMSGANLLQTSILDRIRVINRPSFGVKPLNYSKMNEQVSHLDKHYSKHTYKHLTDLQKVTEQEKIDYKRHLIESQRAGLPRSMRLHDFVLDARKDKPGKLKSQKSGQIKTRFQHLSEQIKVESETTSKRLPLKRVTHTNSQLILKTNKSQIFEQMQPWKEEEKRRQIGTQDGRIRHV